MIASLGFYQDFLEFYHFSGKISGIIKTSKAFENLRYLRCCNKFQISCDFQGFYFAKNWPDSGQSLARSSFTIKVDLHLRLLTTENYKTTKLTKLVKGGCIPGKISSKH